MDKITDDKERERVVKDKLMSIRGRCTKASERTGVIYKLAQECLDLFEAKALTKEKK